MKISKYVHMWIFLREGLYVLLNYQSISGLQERLSAINSVQDSIQNPEHLGGASKIWTGLVFSQS